VTCCALDEHLIEVTKHELPVAAGKNEAREQT
jgi:hypothetical protein